MNKKFRVLSLILSLIMVMAIALTGCQNTGNTTADSGETAQSSDTKTEKTEDTKTEDKTEDAASALEPYVIDYYMLCNAVYEDIDMIEAAVNEITQEEINATVEITMLDWGAYQEKVNAALSAGEKVDIVFTADWYKYIDYVNLGYFSELNDLLQSHGQGIIENLHPTFITGTQVDGINYGVATNKELVVNGGFVFNKALVDKYNLDVTTINSEKDLEPWLELIKENESEEIIPFLIEGWFYTPFVDPFTGFKHAVMWEDNRNEDIMNLWEVPEAVEHFTLLHDWYNKGYIHPDSALDTFDAGNYWKVGNFFVMCQPLQGNQAYAKELQRQTTDGAIELIEKDIDGRVVVNNHTAGSMLAIPVTSQDPERVMMFINMMHTNKELVNTLAFGIEGTHYNKVSDNVVELVPDNGWADKNLPWTLGNQFMHYTTAEEDPLKYEKIQEFSATGYPHVALGFRYNPADVESEVAAVNNAASEYAALDFGAMDPETAIPEMIEKLNAAGLQVILDDIRAKYAEWKALQ